MTTKLKIAIVRQRYSAFGGAERFTDNLISYLNSTNEDEITLITRKWTSGNQNNFNILICNPFYIGRLWRDWSFFKQSCRLIRRMKFDLVQAHERISCADIFRAGDGVHLAWLKLKSEGSRFRYYLDLLSPYHRFTLAHEKKIFSKNNTLGVICNSEMVKNQIAHEYPMNMSIITIIQNSVDAEHFNALGCKDYRNRIRKDFGISDQKTLSIFIGSGFKRKGVPLLIEIFSILDQKHELLILGYDKNLEKYQKRVFKSNANRRIHLVGPVEDIKPYLCAADLYLFPSKYDPLPNSTLEAASVGLPVITSQTTGSVFLTQELGFDAPPPSDAQKWVSIIKNFQPRDHQPPIKYSSLTCNIEMARKLDEFYKSVVKKKREQDVYKLIQ